MSTTERDPRAVLAESIGYLALEDFTHHLKALTALDETTFRTHVEYCEDLFNDRNLPHRWLVHERARHVLHAVATTTDR